MSSCAVCCLRTALPWRAQQVARRCRTCARATASRGFPQRLATAFLWEPGQAVEVTALGAGQCPLAVARVDRLPVLHLATPAAETGLAHLVLLRLVTPIRDRHRVPATTPDHPATVAPGWVITLPAPAP